MNKILPVPALSGCVDWSDREDCMEGQMFIETVKMFTQQSMVPIGLGRTSRIPKSVLLLIQKFSE